MNILVTLHMIVGILAILSLIVTVVYAFGSKPEREWPKSKAVFAATTGFLDLQFLIGLILMTWLLTAGSAVRWVHVILMLIAVVMAHLSSRMRNKNRTAAITTIVAALLLVLIGAGMTSV